MYHATMISIRVHNLFEKLQLGSVPRKEGSHGTSSKGEAIDRSRKRHPKSAVLMYLHLNAIQVYLP